MKRDIEPFLIQVARLNPKGAMWTFVSSKKHRYYNARKNSGKYRVDIPATNWYDLKVPEFK